jgi:carbon storage regulator
MLVLTRKKNERVRVPLGDGKELILTIVELRGDKVRLGFEAPKELAIWRDELIDDDVPPSNAVDPSPAPFSAPSAA